MHSALSRYLLACAAALPAAFAASSAVAQGTTTGTGGTTGTAGLAATDFTFKYAAYDPKQKSWIQMTDADERYFFNRARCECYQDTTNWSGFFKIFLLPTATTATKIAQLITASSFPQGAGRLLVGNNGINCLNPSDNPTTWSRACTSLLNPTASGLKEDFSLTVFQNRPFYESAPIPVSVLFGSLSSQDGYGCGALSSCMSATPCQNVTSTLQTIFFWAQTKGGEVPDTGADIKDSVSLNGTIRAVPINVSASGGNEALTVSWAWPADTSTATYPDLVGVQIFCQRGENLQVFKSGAFSAQYQTASTLCKGMEPPTSAQGPFNNYSPDYLCSGIVDMKTNSYRIEGLQNGIPYGVAVAAVDKYRNISPIYEIAYGYPVPTVDFYSQYKNDGGVAQGGFCAVAGPGGRAGASMILGLFGLAAFVSYRRLRGRRRRGPLTIALLISVGTLALASAPAQAQAIYRDSDIFAETAPEGGPTRGSTREYAIELRFGLYTPNVDSEFASSQRTPNAFIFGSKQRPMWQLEYDWELLQVFGTLAVGASIGYYKENAAACLLSDLQSKGTCTRTGDNTSLRLIPLAAMLIYRFDEAAERWGIPLVPYGKVGLNYTIWTVNNGNGDVPELSSTSRGQGGTAGWQAAVGISLQLDFLDPTSARGFDADVGVNHTYAFFELAHIDGSGLYRKDVLRVGDNTWFAGLMFEF